MIVTLKKKVKRMNVLYFMCIITLYVICDGTQTMIRRVHDICPPPRTFAPPPNPIFVPPNIWQGMTFAPPPLSK